MKLKKGFLKEHVSEHDANIRLEDYSTTLNEPEVNNCFSIQLFREKLWEKAHATTPKGIVGGFEFTVFQRNLKEWQERPWTYVCEC